MPATQQEATFDTGRDLDVMELSHQIGMGTIGAICGFRRPERLGRSTVEFVVGRGYRVRVTIEANDTYTVERVYRRGDQAFIKGHQEHVYCTEVGEVAYRASCFHDEF